MRKGPTKILVADDDAMVRTTVSKILEMFGHAVYAVEGGHAAEHRRVADHEPPTGATGRGPGAR